MKKFAAATAFLFAGLTGNLMASGIVLCYDTVGNGAETQRAAPCASQSNFSVLPSNDFLDWGLPTTVLPGQAYGLGTSLDAVVNYAPDAHGGASWDARSTGLITAGANTLTGFTGGTLYRADQGNLADGFGGASIFNGHFNAQPNAGAGSPFGDHLLGLTQATGPMRIDFDKPVASVGFYISTKTNADFIATIKVYDHINPLSSDIPILTYRIDTNGTGGGGVCSAEANGEGPPCNDAPFVGLDGNSALLGSPMIFRSIVISTNDDSGFLIDSMYLAGGTEIPPGGGEAPEPGSAFMIGGGMCLVALASRKFKVCP